MIFDNFAVVLSLPLLALAARPQKVLLSDVQILTLRGDGAVTAHRRVESIPQLKCVAQKAICDLYSIDIMRCTNQGSSYGAEDIEWSCTAELPEELKLGGTDVICEGYEDPEDPYILRGSCGVEYILALTEIGEEKYPEILNPPVVKPWFNDGEGGEDYSAWLFTIIFIAVLGWIIYSACFAAQANARPRPRPSPPRRRGRGNGGSDYGDNGDGGGGGGGGGWNPGWGPGQGPGQDPHHHITIVERTTYTPDNAGGHRGSGVDLRGFWCWVYGW
ncbi:Store-operated calcium entry-associated regulatory factor [Cladobotryum mycophilum]|uniref:Store-operated calcium entry-associated regulatory factor n=1 Tax=Cladobotryum mycophilum TaxID=491253 RepID=A0ABR0SDF3_9HYPO